MNFDFLKNIMEEHFNKIDVNNFYGEASSVLTIAQKYIDKIKDLEYETPTNLKIRFIYKNKNIGGINGQTILTNKKQGMLIARDKLKTEIFLKNNGISTTDSTVYSSDEIDFARNHLKKYNDPVVIKPLNLSSGRGITLNVDSENFENAWNEALSAYSDNKLNAKIMIQKQLKGIEARFLVIEGQFISAIMRVPANVVGDGKTNIAELIKQKNKQRARNPHLYKVPIKIDSKLLNVLQENNLNLESVLEKNKILFFTDISNIALGGDTLEISHLVSDHLKQLAIKAVDAIPELYSAGVDIMFESFDDVNASVIEVNHAANLIMHHYPWKGEPKKPIIDLIDILLEKNIKKMPEVMNKKLIDESQRVNIGILCLNSVHIRFYDYCAAAAAFNDCEIFYFSPNDINDTAEEIVGKTMIDGKWKQKKYSIKSDIDVIYDRLRAHEHSQYISTYKKLTHLPFSHPNYGKKLDKLDFYDKFSNELDVVPNIIPYQQYKSAQQLLDLLQSWLKVIVKPISGSGGNHLVLIEKFDNIFRVTKDNNHTFLNKADLTIWLNQQRYKEKFVIQKFIKSRTIEDNPFDIRVHMSRNSDNQWSIIKIFPRIGYGYEKISLVDYGGYISKWKGFIERLFGKTQFKSLDKEIKEVSYKSAEIFEKTYEAKLTEIAIDYVISESGNIYFLEMNVNKPGGALHEFDLALHGIGYSKYVAKNPYPDDYITYNLRNKFHSEYN